MDINQSKKDRITKHIEVLEKAYENIVEVLNEDIEKDDAGVIQLKDDKIKIYSEGLKKSAETLEYLFEQIEGKQKELEEINNPNAKKEKKQSVPDRNKHLQ